MLRSRIGEFNLAAEGILALHYSSGLYISKFHLIDNVVDDLERFRSIFFTDTRPFEHFNALIKQSYGLTARQWSI